MSANIPRLFLDFDGVLRREDAPRHELETDCVERLEACVLQHPDLLVVISSTWRHAMTLAALRGLFSAAFAERIEGLTPDLSTDDCEYLRHAEVLGYLRARNAASAPWLALDDQPADFPGGAPVLAVDPARAFDEEIARRVCEWVAECPRPAPSDDAGDLDFSDSP